MSKTSALKKLYVRVENMSNHGAVKCPRCWWWHDTKANFDYLCDKCITSILLDFKDLQRENVARVQREDQDLIKIVDNIKFNLEMQSIYYTHPWLRFLYNIYIEYKYKKYLKNKPEEKKGKGKHK